MNRRILARRALTALLGGSLVLSLAACGVNKQDRKIRANLTPELMTPHERPIDVNNRLILMMDENGRMFWRDLGAAWYTDRPSRLAPHPIAIP